MDNNYFDEILNGLGDTVQEISNGFSHVQRNTDGYAKVKRANSTEKTNIDNTPYLSSNVDVSFNNRIDAFNSYVSNLDNKSIEANKRDGFDAAIKHYQEIINKNKDFKYLEKQIVKDIQDCSNKQNDDYLMGYYQGLQAIRTNIAQSKMAYFRKFANKFE